jgi:23S rRNA-/tRNA-specific pseudouridylate synthase
VAKPKNIELNDGEIIIPILYEDRAVLALDKPAGWMLAPDSWDRTGRNLQLALHSSINAGDFWAHSRNLKFLRFVHRLDAETTGITLFAKSPGALRAYSELFENRRVEKFYLAVVHGIPKPPEWTCNYSLIPDPATKGRMRAIKKPTAQPSELEKDAETHFKTLQTLTATALVEPCRREPSGGWRPALRNGSGGGIQRPPAAGAACHQAGLSGSVSKTHDLHSSAGPGFSPRIRI